MPLGDLRSAAENGLRYGACGYLITDWGDNGHWQVLPMSYLGYAAGAAYSWAYEANLDLDLRAAVSRFAFDDPSGAMGSLAYELGNVYKPYRICRRTTLRCFVFYKSRRNISRKLRLKFPVNSSWDPRLPLTRL